MILQDHEGGLLLFRQTDHALLSASFAAAWGNGTFPRLDRRTELLVAAARHDDGWAEWELAPTVREDGRPVDFIGIPVHEHVALYRHGIDLVEEEDPYAGLVVSMHGERLYTHPFYPGMDPRISKLEGRPRELAEGYVQWESNRQERLLAAIDNGGVRQEAEEAWRLLQIWDRLSLIVCMQPLGPGVEQTMPPARSLDGDVRIDVTGSEDGDVRLSPYPFAHEPCEFQIQAARTDAAVWPDDASFREDYRSAERVLLRFRCRKG